MSEIRPRALLLVEDEALFRRLIVKHLTRQGHEVVEVADAEAALRTYYLQEFDAVITDVHLPGMSGLELGLAIREIRADQPIVFVTGDVDEKLANEALAQGGSGYLLKPFKFFELDAALRQALAAGRVVMPAAPLPAPGVVAPAVDPDSTWKLEQRRLLAAAASKPIELCTRGTTREPQESRVRLILRVLTGLALLLLVAWAVGYWIARNGSREDELSPNSNTPGAGTIYVPTAPRERERGPDRRPNGGKN